MLTSPRYHDCSDGSVPLAVVVGAPVRVGLVLSILILLTVAVLELPAASVALPTADWLAPSSCKVTGAVQSPEGTPEVASVQVNVTVTSELFQPKAFAAGEAAPAIVEIGRASCRERV